MRIPTHSLARDTGFSWLTVTCVLVPLCLLFALGSYVQFRQEYLPLALPAAAVSPSPSTPHASRLTLHIPRTGEWWLAGRRIEPAEFSRQLQLRLEEFGPDLEVRIRGDREIPFGDLAPVVAACTAAGVQQLTFAVQRREGIP